MPAGDAGARGGGEGGREAVGHLLAAVRLRSGYAKAYHALGNLLSAAGARRGAAEMALGFAVRLSPGSGYTYVCMHACMHAFVYVHIHMFVCMHACAPLTRVWHPVPLPNNICASMHVYVSLYIHILAP